MAVKKQDLGQFNCAATSSRVELSRLRTILRCLEFKARRVEQAQHSADLVEMIIQSGSHFRQEESYEKGIFGDFSWIETI